MSDGTVIPGYTHGTSDVLPSPVTEADFELMKQTVLFGDEDVTALQQSREVVQDQVDDILDVWYGFVGSNPHLLATFTNPNDGQPIGDYLDAVRARFGQWILDTTSANYDQAWLDYQHEIGQRHHRKKKNQTDGIASVDIVPFRYLAPLVFPVTATLKPFLAKSGHSDEEVNKMHAAWVKSLLLQVTLWSHAYVRDGDF